MKPIIDENRFSPSCNSPSVEQKDSHHSLQFVQGENISMKERNKDKIITLVPPFEKNWRLSGLNHMGSSFNDNYVSCLVLCSFWRVLLTGLNHLTNACVMPWRKYMPWTANFSHTPRQSSIEVTWQWRKVCTVHIDWMFRTITKLSFIKTMSNTTIFKISSQINQHFPASLFRVWDEFCSKMPSFRCLELNWRPLLCFSWKLWRHQECVY